MDCPTYTNTLSRNQCVRAGVDCLEAAAEPCTLGDVRLRGGPVTSGGFQGRVEICGAAGSGNNTWGTICNAPTTPWGVLSAQVVCRQLNHFAQGTKCTVYVSIVSMTMRNGQQYWCIVRSKWGYFGKCPKFKLEILE